jgi:hypothetical protein
VLKDKVYLSDAMAEQLLHRAVGDGRKEPTRSPLDALARLGTAGIEDLGDVSTLPGKVSRGIQRR